MNTNTVEVVKVNRLNCARKRKVLPRLLKQQNNKCYYCACDLTPVKAKGDGNPKATSATIEHLVPLRDGGRNYFLNMVAACWKCNNGRDHHGQG